MVQLLRQMMIRRTRTYAEYGGKRHGKHAVRRYDRVRYSGADDPFMAMTMALVQKRLVGALPDAVTGFVWANVHRSNRCRRRWRAASERLQPG